jgi:hypothetical protein
MANTVSTAEYRLEAKNPPGLSEGVFATAEGTISIADDGMLYWYSKMELPARNSGNVPYIYWKLLVKDSATSTTTTLVNYWYSETIVYYENNVNKNGWPRLNGSERTRAFALPINTAPRYKVYLSLGAGTQEERYLAKAELDLNNFGSVTPSDVNITDNFDNSFTITSLNNAQDGYNNKVISNTLSYCFTDNTSNRISCNSGDTIKLTPISTDNYRVVTASVRTTGDYNSVVYNSSYGICQYIAPGAGGKPEISYDKNRLTVKEPWTFNWSAPSSKNRFSPIVGYRIRLYKNGEKIAIKDDDGNTLSTVLPTDILYDSSTNATSISIDPIEHGFKAGDKVRLSVTGYTRTGESNTGFLLIDSGTESFSEEYLVQNAGIVHLKTKDSWVEGQVYVKTASCWKEAESVSVRTDTDWKEAT